MIRTRMPPALPLAAGLLLLDCATLPREALDETLRVDAGGAHFVVEYAAADRAAARAVAASLPRVVVHLRRWGEFTRPITIYLHGTHAALEAAVDHPGFPWLRAWARYDTIDLQSPATWGLGSAMAAQLSELLTHELTHCLMYEESASAVTWYFKPIPLWFREGMASVTANQGYRRATRAQLAVWLHQHPDRDLLGAADALYQTNPDIVYGAAHRAFEELDGQYGDAAVESILARISSGASFDEAFRRVTGTTVDSFQRRFMRELGGDPPET